MDTENGPIDRWIADEKLDNEVFHAMSWAHLASGGAGSGLRWPYRNPHHLTEGMLDTLKLMSEFVKEVDWKALSSRHTTIKVVGEKGVAVCGFASARSALLWTSGSDSLELDWAGSTKGRVFDCRSGKWSDAKIVPLVGGRLRIELPTGSGSVAVVLK
jgi:mannan endo-1,4-beta-mannosidase